METLTLANGLSGFGDYLNSLSSLNSLQYLPQIEAAMTGQHVYSKLSTTQIAVSTPGYTVVVDGTGLSVPLGSIMNGPVSNLTLENVGGTVQELQIYAGGSFQGSSVNGGTLILDVTLSPSQWTIVSGTTQLTIMGSQLPTTPATLDSILNGTYAGSGLGITGITLQQAGQPLANMTLSTSSLTVTIGDYQVVLSGANLQSSSGGTITGAVVTQISTGATLLTESNLPTPISLATVSSGQTSLIDALLAQVTKIDASATTASMIVDLRAGGEIGIAGDTLSHANSLGVTTVLLGTGADTVYANGSAPYTTAVFQGPHTAYSIASSYLSTFCTVTNLTTHVVDTLSGVTLLSFNDGAAYISAGHAWAFNGTAASISSNLDSYQSLASQYALSVIEVTDGAAIAITAAQLSKDAGALARIGGNYKLAVSSVSASGATTTAGTAHVASIAVSDSAANVTANLDSLASLAASGKLGMITLTDGGTPTLSITATQAGQDVAALNAIGGSHTLNVTGTSPSIGTFLAQQDASGRGANGIGADYAGTAPAGGNSVVGFQSANFSGGIDTVILDGPRSSYAIAVAADGTTTIKDVGVGDANYNQSVKVSGESYIVFNAANLAASTVMASGAPTYPGDMYFIETQANAQLAEFYAAVFQRSPDLAGLEYWQGALAQGGSILNVAQDFLAIIHSTFSTSSPITTLGGDPYTMTNTQFITELYQNILGRQPDPGGLAYWQAAMTNGASQAQILVAFTGATATISAVNAEAGASVGTGSGWLIAPSASAGYADPGLQMTASSVLAQAAQSNDYTLSLIDPTTVPAGGLTVGGATLTPGALQLSATAPAASIVLSSSFTTLTAANSGDVIHDGPGADSITVTGSGDFITVGTATTDVLHLGGGTNSFVFNFVPGHGSLIDASGTVGGGATTLLNGTTTAVHGSSLTFGAGAAPIYVNIGNTGGGTAPEVVTAANKTYVPADVAGEHVVFLGTDSAGDTQLWSYKTDGAHVVDTGALTLIATLIGVPAVNLTAADLA